MSPPRALTGRLAKPLDRDALAFLMDSPSAPAWSVRINLKLPAGLVAAADRPTRNRSRVLADAARAKLDGAA